MRDLPDRPMTYKDRLGFALALCVAALVMLSACNLQPGHPAPLSPASVEASEVYKAQRDLIKAVKAHYPDLKLEDTLWKPCDGELNSWYDTDKRRVELCTDMSKYPDAAMFYAAHEVGHAITYQFAGTLDEGSADVVGALEMVRLGMQDKMRAAAAWYHSRPQIHTRYEEHPGHEFRAWVLECFADGSEQPDSDCAPVYSGAKTYWELRLAQPQTADLEDLDLPIEAG